MIKIIPDIITAATQSFPNKEAFRFNTDFLTYAELDKKTNQLAAHLVTLGVKKGDRVGVYMNRCIQTVIAIYGIMKSGAAYVPLDATAPNKRTLFLLNDCDIEILVTTPKRIKNINKILLENTRLRGVVGVSEQLALPSFSWNDIFESDSNYKPCEIYEDDLAYIMYTSGSTGAPKGIMHSHRSGLAYAKLSSELYGLKPEDRVANHAPLHFDISTFGYFSAPYACATTVIVSDAHTKMPTSLGQLMEKEQISIWYSVPLALVQLYLSNVLDLIDLKALRWVIFGGENFTLKYLKALISKWPHCEFSNSYGPAEVNQCTYYNFRAIGDGETTVPIGTVWGNNEYKIVDEDDVTVADGKAGTLLMKSSTMMLGYWNNTELTEKSIFKINNTDGTTSSFYRTGDIVKKDFKGNLIFLGREDRQVKLRGYRIELDEIEAVLTSHPAIKQAAVNLYDFQNEEKKLIAGVLLTPDKTVSNIEITTFCRKYLPVYAVPEKIEVLDEFPKTSSGKTDLIAMKNKLITL